MFDVKGQVVAITGASSGIGEAAARLLATSGAKVLLGARRTDRLEIVAADIRKKEGKADVQTIDVCKREDLERFVKKAQDRFGRLDVLISNAGLMPLSPLDQLKVDEWDRMIDVNIKGVLYGIAAALPVFRKQNSGHFINVSSVAGHRIAPSTAVYSGTKFAVASNCRKWDTTGNLTILARNAPNAGALGNARSASGRWCRYGRAAVLIEPVSAESLPKTGIFAEMDGDFWRFPSHVRQSGSPETKANARKARISGPLSRL